MQDLYPSRQDKPEEFISRPDPVVFGEGQPTGEHSLTPDQVDFYDKNGFIVLEGLLSDRVEALAQEVSRIGRENPDALEVFTEPDSQQLRSIFDLPKFSPMIADLSRDPRFLDVATQLLGGDVYLHQSRVNIKPAHSGRSFPWHSDFETWHVEDGLPRCRTLTGWVMLTENTAYNGPLFVIPGSQRTYVSCEGLTPDENYRQSLRRQEYGSPSLSAIEALAKESGIVGVYGKPGTVVFHEGNIMHGSPDNISPWPRTNLFFVYNSVENAPVKPYGAAKKRPTFLANPDTTPLKRNDA